jgi:nitrate reductase gamma subunit
MLDALIDLATGPLLRFSLILMALGLARVLLLQVTELVLAWRRAGDPVVPWRIVARRNLVWTLPWRSLRRADRIAYNFASLVFHVGVIAVPVLLAGHTAIWGRRVGIWLPSLPAWAADLLSLVTVVAVCGLLAGRVAIRAARHLSEAQDWILPALLLFVFLAGLGVAHPTWSPVNARALYLLHVLAGEVLLVLVPFSKLQHMVLFWTSQASTELGWRFSPGAGERVRLSLGKQGQGV